jgi:very-short-patch-repair endonuclease
VKCKYCNRIFNSKGNLSKHLLCCEKLHKYGNEIIHLYNEGFSYEKLSKRYNIGKGILSNFFKDNNIHIRNSSESSKLAHKLYPESFKHSKETKLKLRILRLEWMKNNPDKTAWRKSNISYPEKIFLDELLKKKWDEKYLIIREKSFFPYFADFTFENFKLVIEIDGSQHLLQDRREKDIEKEKLIISEGYKIFRFTENEIKNSLDQCFNKIIDFIQNSDNYNNISKFGIFKKNIKYYCRCGNEKSKKSKSCNKCSNINRSISQRKVKRPPYNQLMSEIKEFGYIGTGRKYSVSDNTIRKWINFYNKYNIT